MSILLIPVAPLSKSKSRLSSCFSRDQLKEFTTVMFKDLGIVLRSVNCFDKKVVYCQSPEILELAENFDLIGIKEKSRNTNYSLDDVIRDLDEIVINEFNAKDSVLTFLDLIMIWVSVNAIH